MRTINSLEKLDEQLDAAAIAATRSQNDFRKVLDGFVFDPREVLGKLPKDPRSDDYRAAQMRLYALIAGSTYKTENEKTPFDHAHMMRWPFPYSTRSASLVGDYLMTYGNLIKTMDLAKDARVLEIGSGYGPLTYQLASMGHHVTCVDVHEPLLTYVRDRTSSLPGKVQTLVADMNDLELNDTFDAIIFFESFHHGADHIGMLKRLPKWLEPNGVLVLAGEPIVPAGALAVPYPWGLRLDGLSLWFIRRLGWLELGFQEGYLRKLLEDLGWGVVCRPNYASPTMGVWLAKRSTEEAEFTAPSSEQVVANWNACDSRMQTQVGMRNTDNTGLRSTGKAGYLLYGPYVPLDCGFYEVQWEGRVHGAGASGRVDVACNGGLDVLRASDYSIAKRTRSDASQVLAHLRFKVWEPVQDLEFRLQIDADVDLEITRVVLHKR